MIYNNHAKRNNSKVVSSRDESPVVVGNPILAQ